VHGIIEGIHQSISALNLALLDTCGEPVCADAMLAK
jgi:hypothetical protein